MASVGGYTATTLSGPVNLSAIQSALITRPGVDGFDIQDLGLRGEPYQMQATFQSASEALMLALKETIMGLQGTLVTVVDMHGNEYNDQFIQRAFVLDEKYMPVVVSGGNYKMIVAFEMVDANV